jgi:hypothetical protein
LINLLASIAFGWALIGAGTFLFLVVLAVRAFLNGGLPAFRQIDLGFPGLFLALLAMSVCWPWAWVMLSDRLNEKE